MITKKSLKNQLGPKNIWSSRMKKKVNDVLQNRREKAMLRKLKIHRQIDRDQQHLVMKNGKIHK